MWPSLAGPRFRRAIEDGSAYGWRVLLDVADRVPNRAELLDRPVWDIEIEFVLDPHHDLDQVQAVQTELAQNGAIGQRGSVDRPNGGDDLADTISGRHGFPLPRSFYADLTIINADANAIRLDPQEARGHRRGAARRCL